MNEEILEPCDSALSSSASSLQHQHASEQQQQRQQQQQQQDREQQQGYSNHVESSTYMPVDLRVMSSTPDYHKMIDNSRIHYVPIKLRCGVTAMCRSNVLILCPFVLQCLHKDVLKCLEIMPRSVHALIKRTRIWVNVSYSYGQRDNPRLLRHTTAHHADWWLIW